jgi:hypothetical protein
VKKVRPVGWSKFNEDAVSKIKQSKGLGYNFSLPFTGNRKVDIIFDNPYIAQPIVTTSISLEDSLAAKAV